MNKTDTFESVTLSVVQHNKRKLFELIRDDEIFHMRHIPVGSDFAGGNVKAYSGDDLVADFNVHSANTGILMAPPEMEVPQIAYLDGLIGKFRSASVIGTSMLDAKDLAVGDTVRLKATSVAIANLLDHVKATAQNKTDKITAHDQDEWDYTVV